MCSRKYHLFINYLFKNVLLIFQLCSYGIDLCYQLDGVLITPLIKALLDTRDKLIDSVKVRALEDKWIPTNLNSKIGLNRCLSEHKEMGLELELYITGKYSKIYSIL